MRLLRSATAQDRTAPYLFVSPFFLIYGIFGLFPVIFTFYMSFFQWDLLGTREFIGTDNYARLLEDPLFWKALRNTLSIFLISTVPQLALALVIAAWLNDKRIRGTKVFRFGLLFPYVTSSVAVAIIFTVIFSERYGIVNYLLDLVGVAPIQWQGSVTGTHVAISTMVLWTYTGYTALIYLAGMHGLPRDVYDAAAIDGAGRIRQFFAITLPMLRPVILFTVIISTIGGMQTVVEPLLFSGIEGGGSSQGLTLELYLYGEAFIRASFGYAAAIAVAVIFIAAALSVVNYFLVSRSTRTA